MILEKFQPLSFYQKFRIYLEPCIGEPGENEYNAVYMYKALIRGAVIRYALHS